MLRTPCCRLDKDVTETPRTIFRGLALAKKQFRGIKTTVERPGGIQYDEVSHCLQVSPMYVSVFRDIEQREPLYRRRLRRRPENINSCVIKPCDNCEIPQLTRPR